MFLWWFYEDSWTVFAFRLFFNQVRLDATSLRISRSIRHMNTIDHFWQFLVILPMWIRFRFCLARPFVIERMKYLFASPVRPYREGEREWSLIRLRTVSIRIVSQGLPFEQVSLQVTFLGDIAVTVWKMLQQLRSTGFGVFMSRARWGKVCFWSAFWVNAIDLCLRGLKLFEWSKSKNL